MIIAEVSIAPLGVGTSVSKYVKEAVKILKSSGLKVTVGGMSTTIEAPDLETLFKWIAAAENAEINAGAKRVLIHLKVDDRRDKDASINSKVSAVDL
jgi:uncharacterized protein (TIGR00106 family)